MPPYYYQKLLKRVRWKTWDRGPRVRVPPRGVENTECGKHAQGLVENTGELLFRPTMNFLRLNEKSQVCYFKLQ